MLVFANLLAGLGHAASLPPDPAPFFRLSPEGFRIEHPRADSFGFLRPISGETVLREKLGTQEWGWPAKPLEPSRLRIHRFGEGFDLFFAKGFALRIGSLAAPYLSWEEGSVGPNITAPNAGYIVISFRDDQPPLALGFPSQKTSMKITGRPGQWVLRSGTEFNGWVRVVAPLRSQPRMTTDAKSLGKLLADLKYDLPRWTQPAPNFTGVSAVRTAAGLLATWSFDAPNAVLSPLLEAGFDAAGVRPLVPKSPIGRTAATGVRWSKDRQLKVLFPQSRWWPGRPLASAQVPFHRIDRNDPNAVIGLALENHVSGRDPALRDYAMQILNEFAQRIGPRYDLVSATLPPKLVAAYALLGQVVAPNRRGVWLDELGGRVSNWSWTLPLPDQPTARATAAIASLALGLDEDPVLQLKGAMLDLGSVLAERDGAPPVLRPLRDQIFGGVAGTLSESCRILTMQACTASVADGQLVLSKLALEPGQEIRLWLPRGMGPLVGGIRASTRAWTSGVEWVGANTGEKPTEWAGRFGPATAIPAGVAQFPPVP